MEEAIKAYKEAHTLTENRAYLKGIEACQLWYMLRQQDRNAQKLSRILKPHEGGKDGSEKDM